MKNPVKKKNTYPLWATLPADKEMLLKGIAKKKNLPLTHLTRQALIEFIERNSIEEI
jgi:hypothetical protein